MSQQAVELKTGEPFDNGGGDEMRGVRGADLVAGAHGGEDDETEFRRQVRSQT
jgi:hypothetical protein